MPPCRWPRSWTVIGAGYFHDGNEVHPAGVALSVAASLGAGRATTLPGGDVRGHRGAGAHRRWSLDRGIAPYTMLIPAAALFSLALFGSTPGALARRPRRRRDRGRGRGAEPAPARTSWSRPGTWPCWPCRSWPPRCCAPAGDYRSVLGERLALVKLTREQEARRRVQDERLRIARDLHDVVAHTLTTINVQASVAGHLLDSRPEQARHALDGDRGRQP